MKPTTVTNVSVDGVMQGRGGPDEDRWGGYRPSGRAQYATATDDQETT
jgi:hypothetical protein